MFTASLEIMDLDMPTMEDAARALLDNAGQTRPIFVQVTHQHTGEKRLVPVLDHTPLLDLLYRNLEAWEGEEESVTEEHEELIADLRKFLEGRTNG